MPGTCKMASSPLYSCVIANTKKLHLAHLSQQAYIHIIYLYIFVCLPQFLSVMLCSSARIRKLINSSPKQFLSIYKRTLFSFVQIPPISHPITTGFFSSSINHPNNTSTSTKPLLLGFRSDHSMASQSSNPQSIHDFTVKVSYFSPLCFIISYICKIQLILVVCRYT